MDTIDRIITATEKTLTASSITTRRRGNAGDLIVAIADLTQLEGEVRRQIHLRSGSLLTTKRLKELHSDLLQMRQLIVERLNKELKLKG